MPPCSSPWPIYFCSTFTVASVTIILLSALRHLLRTLSLLSTRHQKFKPWNELLAISDAPDCAGCCTFAHLGLVISSWKQLSCVKAICCSLVNIPPFRCGKWLKSLSPLKKRRLSWYQLLRCAPQSYPRASHSRHFNCRNIISPVRFTCVF